jgi:iron complex outermembrane receptor protein
MKQGIDVHTVHPSQRRIATVSVLLAMGPLTAIAADSPSPASTQGTPLEEVVVQGAAIKKLDLNTESATGSRLGLTALETPATLEAIGTDTMRARGLVSVTEAAESMVGVNSGENPGAPSAFSMRGFTDNQITSLRDGLQIGPASMVMRPQNTFNLERVEVLKGPASVLYGEGAIAGTINAITKKPRIGAPGSYEFLASYGRYNSYQLGAGAGGSLGSDAAYRLDVSRTASDGWVDRTSSNSNNVTASVLWVATPTFNATVNLDYLKDALPNNWGQPLVPASFAKQPIRGVVETVDGRVLDESMRFTNYNVGDNLSDSHQIWATTTLRWTPSETISVRDDVYHFDAKREWANAEQYVFDAQMHLVTRDRFFVNHDQTIIGNRTDVTVNHPLGGHGNRFLASVDYNKIDFDRVRGFPDGDAVDPFNPQPGSFGARVGKLSAAVIKTTAVSFEDVLDLTSKWKLITGARREHVNLDRNDFDFDGSFLPASSFSRSFAPTSWRAGATYEFLPANVLYGQWSTGQDPVGTELFSVEASQNFDLAQSRQWELGYKASINGGMAEVTLAYFDILREHILTQIAQDKVSNVGSQKSRGVEFASSVYLSRHWQASANVAYVDASYGDFVNPDFGITASGNRPPNVAKWTANAWMGVNQIGGLPLEVGGGVRFVDDRFADYANRVTLKSYALINAYAAYTMGTTRLMLRSRNLTNKEYVPWVSPFYPNQLALGSPRVFELSVETKF